MPPATYLACPTDVVEAPIQIVWSLLTNFSGWGNFYDVRVINVEPPGPAAVGQRMVGESGPRFLHLRLTFQYTLIDEPNHELEIDLNLPFGITVHEALDSVVVSESRCRVNYHCHFGFPSGWRGQLVRFMIGRKRFFDGPADSLQRLKRAAEQEYRSRNAKSY